MTTYVCGHRNPDTDSIVAAISYATLYNMLGENDYVPARLGHLNDETKFLMERFGFEPPMMISSVRTQIYNTEIRYKGCEMIIRDFRTCVGNSRKKCGLTYTRESHKTYIGDHLKLQHKILLRSRLSGLCVLRRLHDTCYIVSVSTSAVTAMHQCKRFSPICHIDYDLTGLEISYNSSRRDFKRNVCSVRTMAVSLTAFLTVTGLILSDISEIRKGIESRIHNNVYISAVASVPAVRTAVRNIKFSTEGHMAVAALT